MLLYLHYLLFFIAGLVFANAAEWFIHKYFLHHLGKRKNSFWAFHWHEHHRSSRQHNMLDTAYGNSLWEWTPKSKEAVSLIGAAVGAMAFWPLSPAFTVGVWSSILAYYVVHRKSHTDTAWAYKWLPWHVDHHMGKDQDANWCVTWPLFDYIMGTRKKYESKSQP